MTNGLPLRRNREFVLLLTGRAGVVVDRWNRRRLMIAADGVRALAIAAEANIVAGEALHGLTDLLPDAVAVRLREAPRDLAALLAGHDGRRLVLVVRDAARHAWQQATVESAAELRPDAIVVETGIPWFRADGVASIVTHGAGRANLAAAAQALAGVSVDRDRQ